MGPRRGHDSYDHTVVIDAHQGQLGAIEPNPGSRTQPNPRARKPGLGLNPRRNRRVGLGSRGFNPRTCGGGICPGYMFTGGCLSGSGEQCLAQYILCRAGVRHVDLDKAGWRWALMALITKAAPKKRVVSSSASNSRAFRVASPRLLNAVFVYVLLRSLTAAVAGKSGTMSGILHRFKCSFSN